MKKITWTEIATIIIIIGIMFGIPATIMYAKSDDIAYEWIISFPDDPIVSAWYMKNGWRAIYSPDNEYVYLYYNDSLDDEEKPPAFYPHKK